MEGENEKTKEGKGVSRRMFCKLASGGAVAIGGSCLMSSLHWRIGEAGPPGVQAAERVMTIIKIDEVPKEPYITPLFTGPDVTRQSLVADSKELRLSIVNFGKGVRK